MILFHLYDIILTSQLDVPGSQPTLVHIPHLLPSDSFQSLLPSSHPKRVPRRFSSIPRFLASCFSRKYHCNSYKEMCLHITTVWLGIRLVTIIHHSCLHSLENPCWGHSSCSHFFLLLFSSLQIPTPLPTRFLPFIQQFVLSPTAKTRNGVSGP